MGAILSVRYSDKYTNKLCKFRRGQQKLGVRYRSSYPW